MTRAPRRRLLLVGTPCALLVGVLSLPLVGPADARPATGRSAQTDTRQAQPGCRIRSLGRREARGAVQTAVHRVVRTERALAPGAYPSTTNEHGRWVTTGRSAWTSGFFPGSLWQVYAATGEARFRREATAWTRPLAPQALVTSTHDIGFQLMSSFGDGYAATRRDSYRQTLLRGAQSLATRYSPVVGAIRSWGRRSDDRHFKVIVDSLMNLDLPFWASAHGGPSRWRGEAARHAETVAHHFVRRDGSVRHLVDFDPATGAVLGVANPQGYRPSSTWSRGQAWAIHGFATAYRYTRRPDLLRAARRTASFYLRDVPGDCVPYWDFDAPGIPDTPRDSSAAAIAADGLAELSMVDPSAARRTTDRRAAASILATLVRHYVAPSGFAVLDGATGTFSVTPPGIGTAYGDYYFLHALEAFLHSR